MNITRKHIAVIWTICLFTGLLFSNCEKEQFTEIEKSDLQKMNVYGQVKTITQYYYEAIDSTNPPQKGRFEWKQVTEFNQAGNKLWDTYLNEEGFISTYTEFHYNENGNVIEENCKNWGSVLRYKYTFEYDDNGNQVKMNYFNEDSMIWQICSNSFDENGFLIESRFLNIESGFEHMNTFDYDYNGNLKKHSVYDIEDQINSWITYDYDKLDRLVKDKEYRENELLIKTIYDLDELGNVVKDYMYNRRGELSYWHSFIFTYQGDNWIQCIRCYEETPQRIIEREFVFY